MSVSKSISLCECRKTEKLYYKLTVTEKKIVHKSEHNELFPIGLFGWLVYTYYYWPTNQLLRKIYFENEVWCHIGHTTTKQKSMWQWTAENL